MKRISQYLAYLAVRAACALLTPLPLRFSYYIARALGDFTGRILGFRRKIVLENLRIAFGDEMTPDALKSIAAETYRQTAMTFIELLIAPKLADSAKQMLEQGHFSLVRRLLHQGKGLVAVSGHLGNWELQGAAAAIMMDAPFTVAAVQQSNPYINRFITRRRTEMGMEVAGTKEAMKLLIRALKQRQAVGLVADQNAGGNAVFVDFFGKTAATHPGPAKLALKFNAPMIVGATVRTGPGRFKMLVQQVEISADDTVETLTQRHVKILESFIRQYPEQYFWLHRRWKTRPARELPALKTRDA